MNAFSFSEEVQKRFEEEGIDDESFELLDDATIEKIFPRAGPRLIFKKKYGEYKAHKLDVFDQIQNCPTPEYSTSSDTLTYSSENDFIEIEMDDKMKTVFKLDPKEIISDQINKRKSDDDAACSSSMKKIMAVPEIFDEGLEKILGNSIDGQIVLMRKDNLNNDCRQRLVKEIINHLISKLGVDGVKTFILDYVAEEIPKLFPNEIKETYFIPYSKKSSGTSGTAAKGKLWSRYVNVRNAIKVAESKTVKKSKTPSPSAKDCPNKNIELEILKSIVEPKEKVLDLWNETYQQRRYILRSLSLTVEDIFDHYAALSTSIGPELIKCDFMKKHDKNDIVYTNLPNVANAILAEAESRKVVAVQPGSNVDPILKALLTLPYLFPPVTLKNKRKSGNWRPSRSEISESFFMHIENFEELEERKCQRLKKLGECNLTLQPFGVICGPLNKVSKFLVVINDCIYTFESITRAVEILYKAFHTFDIQYPHECQHIWQLLENIVFEMKTSPISCAVTALMSDLKRYL